MDQIEVDIHANSKLRNNLKGISYHWDIQIDSFCKTPNRAQIRANIIEVNRSILEFNFKVQQFRELQEKWIWSKQKLNILEDQLKLKESKIKEIEQNHEKCDHELETAFLKYKEIQEDYQKLTVGSVKYKEWRIEIRRNDIVDERSVAIMSLTDSSFSLEGPSKAIVNKGGDVKLD